MIGDDGPFVVRLRAVLPHSPRGHSPVVVDADRAETPCTEAVGAYLTGLLPDSEATLERLGRRYGVSPRNPFALLRHIGRDAAGAVQVLPDGVGASDAASRRGDVEWLSDVDVRSLVGEVAAHPSDWDPRRDAGRWSLAGAQAKVALFRGRDGRWAIPRDSTPTTHVLKPAPAHLRGHHAHAKNYSVLLDGPRAVLAPLYDVASYLTYDAEPGAQSAMKIGSTWDMATVTNRDWAAVGRKLGLSEDDALGRVDSFPRQSIRSHPSPAFPTTIEPTRNSWPTVSQQGGQLAPRQHPESDVEL